MNENFVTKIMAMERIEALSKFRRAVAESYQEHTSMIEKQMLSYGYSKIESAVEDTLDAEIKYLSTLL